MARYCVYTEDNPPVASGYIHPGSLASGTANATTYLRGDGTWTAPPGGGTPSGTVADLDGTGNAGTSNDYARGDHRHGGATTPLAHAHAEADVAGLVSDLAGKAATVHTHLKADVTDFAHTHAEGDVTNLVTDLAGKAASSHAHAIGDTTNLQTTLDGKAATTHTHAATDLASGTVATARLGSGSATSSTFLRGDSTWATPGGADPWTYVILGGDFSTTSATAVNVTGLLFTPAANTQYEFEALLLTRTATATVGPRPGLSWPTGMTDGMAMIQQTSSATANVFANGNIAAALLAPVGGVPTTTGSWPARIKGTVLAGASPSGNVQLQLASETAGTSVTVKAKSYLRYRTVA